MDSTGRVELEEPQSKIQLIRHLRWHIVALLTLVTVVNYLDRNSLAVAQTVLED